MEHITSDVDVTGNPTKITRDACRHATPRAIYHAWLLARAHGHHWASSASQEALAYGRAILAHKQAPSDDDERAQLEARLRAAQAAYDAWMARPLAERSTPPKTVEEAEALAAIPSGPIAGLGFSLSHRTQSGRLEWDVNPHTGAVVITVFRPTSRPCLRLEVSGDLRRVVVETGPASLRVRHVAAANRCLTALGLPVISPGDALLADEMGRTPAWWEAHEAL